MKSSADITPEPRDVWWNDKSGCWISVKGKRMFFNGIEDKIPPDMIHGQKNWELVHREAAKA
jgi:hypothetical protein